MRPGAVKPLIWIASSKKNLLAMPDEVQDVLGFALHQAQIGGKSDLAKPLKRFGSAGILEIVEDSDGDAYRAVYTVRFETPSTCCTASRRNPSRATGRRRRT